MALACKQYGSLRSAQFESAQAELVFFPKYFFSQIKKGVDQSEAILR